jgi:hypothetical protein
MPADQERLPSALRRPYPVDPAEVEAIEEEDLGAADTKPPPVRRSTSTAMFAPILPDSCPC